jgi:hypothetical protein
MRYRLLDRFPDSVRRFFASPVFEETPKPGDLSARAWTLLDATNLSDAAQRQAQASGFDVVVDNSCDDSDYCAAAEFLLNRMRALLREYPSICLVSAGEWQFDYRAPTLRRTTARCTVVPESEGAISTSPCMRPRSSKLRMGDSRAFAGIGRRGWQQQSCRRRSRRTNAG